MVVLIYWYADVLVCCVDDCPDVFIRWYVWCVDVDVLMTVLMTLCWCVDVLMCLMCCVFDVLMCWCVDVLMCLMCCVFDVFDVLMGLMCWCVDDCVDVLMGLMCWWLYWCVYVLMTVLMCWCVMTCVDVTVDVRDFKLQFCDFCAQNGLAQWRPSVSRRHLWSDSTTSILQIIRSHVPALFLLAKPHFAQHLKSLHSLGNFWVTSSSQYLVPVCTIDC
jgi:hypothetical protein